MKNFIARTTPWNTVQFGDGYWLLSPSERQAVLAHEMGHIVHNHSLKRIFWLVSLRALLNPEGYWGMCAEQELQADEYAGYLGCAESLKAFLRKGKETGAPGYPPRKERIERLSRV